MKKGAILLLPLLVFTLFVFDPETSFAKSGCCSGHGGVSCSAGPQGNGNVICNDGWRGSSCSYSGMVMCGGSSSSIFTPNSTPKPVVIFTPKPTSHPTPVVTPILTSELTSELQVQGVATQSPELTAGDTVIGLGFLGVTVGLPLWLIRKAIVRHNNRINV